MAEDFNKEPGTRLEKPEDFSQEPGTVLEKPRRQKQDENPSPEQEPQEESQEAQETSNGLGSLVSPEGMVMLALAIFFDLMGILLFFLSLFGIGIIISWLCDALALLMIGGWMFFKLATKSAPGLGQSQKGKITNRRVLKRLGIAGVIEMIPFVGDIWPSWIIAVYKTLKET